MESSGAPFSRPHRAPAFAEPCVQSSPLYQSEDSLLRAVLRAEAALTGRTPEVQPPNRPLCQTGSLQQSHPTLSDWRPHRAAPLRAHPTVCAHEQRSFWVAWSCLDTTDPESLEVSAVHILWAASNRTSTQRSTSQKRDISKESGGISRTQQQESIETSNQS